VWSLPVTIPDSPLRYTLCYLLYGDSALIVVDPGWDDERTWQDLTRGLKEAGTARRRSPASWSPTCTRTTTG
jgi:glyoxylase-like metal-dependent hydrolase (beta-lactamase superfamily II)